jgi:hypothetical protein
VFYIVFDLKAQTASVQSEPINSSAVSVQDGISWNPEMQLVRYQNARCLRLSNRKQNCPDCRFEKVALKTRRKT